MLKYDNQLLQKQSFHFGFLGQYLLQHPNMVVLLFSEHSGSISSHSSITKRINAFSTFDFSGGFQCPTRAKHPSRALLL